MSAGRGCRAKEQEEDEDLEEVMKEAVSRRPSPEQVTPHIPEAVDDFLRNFLRKAGLSRTLGSFEAEWYGTARRRATAPDTVFIPDALTHRHVLQLELDSVRRDTELLRREAMAAAESLVRMQREKDFHRLQSEHVAEQKNKLVHDFQQLKKRLQSYVPALRQVEDKHQTALRQKTLISLQKDRVQTTTDPRLGQEKAAGKKCQKN